MALREAADSVLDSFAVKDGVAGIALVARDGLPVAHRFSGPCNADAVCAMAAAMMGAADAALLDMGGKEALRLHADSDGLRLSAGSIDEDLMLLLVCDGGGPDELLGEAIAAMRVAIQEA